MNNRQQEIIDCISAEISQALVSCEHHSHESGGNPDEIDFNIDFYAERAKRLREIRLQLENEFTIMHYDPR